MVLVMNLPQKKKEAVLDRKSPPPPHGTGGTYIIRIKRGSALGDRNNSQPAGRKARYGDGWVSRYATKNNLRQQRMSRLEAKRRVKGK